MIPPREVLDHILAAPFVPFRIHTASGRTFDVPHPEYVKVGATTMTVYTACESADPDGPPGWEKISLSLVESIAPSAAPVRA